MATLATRKLSEQFEEFLKTVTNKSGEYVYRSSISQLSGSGGKSLIVDYEDLLRYDDELAKRLLEEPDKTLESFRTAAFETLRSESPSYADHIARLLAVRIKGIQDRVPLRRVDTSHIDKMIAVSGMIVRTSELRPLMTEAAFVCEKGDLTYQKQQDDMLMKKPLMCETCDSRNLELDKKRSKFIDYQILRIQELPEELPPGQLPQFFDVNAEGDIVNSARPGDRVVLTGVMRAVPDYSPGQLRMRLFRSQIDCNYIEVIGKEPEHVQITRDDEALIRSVASRPDAYQKLIASIAPAITGHEPEREAILLLLAGGVATHLPDGTKLRGDINVLFVGDPGCLVADERVVLGNGAIMKMGQVGAEHLQPLNVQVLTGEGGGRRAMATRFHMYRSQRIIEVTTESGKSIKGTPNHPLLRVQNEEGRLVRAWCRLDKFKVGDRVAVVTGFPCTIREFVRTNFVPIERHKFGPKFKARLPDRMTPQLAAFCGYVLGDGWISNDSNHFGFVVAEPELDILPTLLSVVKEVFGLEPKVSRRLRKGRRVPLHYVYMSNKDIAANLSFLRQKRVPDPVLRSGNKVVSSFLAWLYEADGSVFAKGRGSRAISLKAKDIELLRDVQLLLLRFGIHSRIVGGALLIRRGEDMSRFARRIGFVSAKKKTILKSLTAEAQNFGRVHRQRSERIVSISTQGPADVYDIEVPDGHRFIANGIISHNTAKSEMLKFAAQVAPRGLFASGRGSTAAGLSAAVIREKNVFMLEAGVVVLADQGIAAIDEFDKMRPEDRSALHEQMEQQSYHPSSEILLTDGRKVEIGKFVDGLFSSSVGRILGKDCEILPVDDYGVYTMTSTGGVTSAEIARVSRHMAPENFAVIHYSNGRKIVVTPEHPLFVFRRGRLATIPASEVTEGDFVPAPRALPSSSQEAGLRSVELSGRKNVTQVEALSPRLGRILGYLVSEGNFYEGSSAEVDFTNLNPAILQDMKTLMEKTFGVAPTLRFVDGVPAGLRYVSTTLLSWFRANFPELTTKARTKRVPMKVFASSVAVVGQFLSGAFLGDGSVESEAVCFRTSSRLLAEDYQDLLAKVGIDSRLNVDRSNDSYKTYVAGHALPRFFMKILDDIDPRRELIERLVRRGERRNRNHDVLPTDVGRAIIGLHDDLGIAYNGKFWGNLRGNTGITRKTVLQELSKLESKLEFLNTILEGTRVPIRTLRKLAGWSQSQVARYCALPRRSVNYFERGGYASAERAKLDATLRAGLRQHLSETSKNIAELRQLLALRFLRVRTVELVPNSGALATKWVYDMTVEPTHNFVSSGVVLHNSVTIAKGGIYATLNARTAILAAANPLLGKYNPFQNLTENIALPIPLLSRFDIIFIIKDTPTPAEDERLASHILAVHRKHGYNVPPPIEFSLLKKYIAYAKKISPTLTKESEERIKDFYLDLRRRSSADQIGATPRTLESLIRLATARARILLRDQVTEEDALSAIALMNKMVEDVLTDQETKTRADFGVLLGRPAGERGKLATAIEVLKRLEGTDKKPVERRVFKEELLKTTKFADDEDAEKVIKSMFKEGLIYESKPGFFRRVGS